MPRSDRVLTATAALATVVGLAAVGARVSSGPRLPPIPDEHQPRVVPEWKTYGAVGARLGPERAPVTIVFFTDYLCQYCAYAAEDLAALRSRFSDKLAVVVRHRPSLTDLSRPAALAAVCAESHGHFPHLHRSLFSQVDSLGFKPWSALAKEAGMSDSRVFGECMTSPEVANRIAVDLSAADELQITGTPALLVDSLLFSGSPGRTYLRAYIQRASSEESR